MYTNGWSVDHWSSGMDKQFIPHYIMDVIIYVTMPPMSFMITSLALLQYTIALVQAKESWNIWVDEYINSLGPSDAIWRWRSWSTLVQVMACCLTAPSHYLDQCWLITSNVMWHSSEMWICEETNQLNKIVNSIFRITFRSPRDQWVKWY